MLLSTLVLVAALSAAQPQQSNLIATVFASRFDSQAKESKTWAITPSGSATIAFDGTIQLGAVRGWDGFFSTSGDGLDSNRLYRVEYREGRLIPRAALNLATWRPNDQVTETVAQVDSSGRWALIDYLETTPEPISHLVLIDLRDQSVRARLDTREERGRLPEGIVAGPTQVSRSVAIHPLGRTLYIAYGEGPLVEGPDGARFHRPVTFAFDVSTRQFRRFAIGEPLEVFANGSVAMMEDKTIRVRRADGSLVGTRSGVSSAQFWGDVVGVVLDGEVERNGQRGYVMQFWNRDLTRQVCPEVLVGAAESSGELAFVLRQASSVAAVRD
jgi:hypothetical protein